MKTITGIFLSFMFLYSCLILADEPAIQPGHYARSFELGKIKRSYHIYIPRTYDGKTALPLVFVFHGGGARANGLIAERTTGFTTLAERHGFIAVYPDGVEHHWNDGRESPRFPKHQQDDVGFIAELLDFLQGELNIDARRIYATGMSNGGFFIHRLGVELSDRFSAIASVAATYGKNMIKTFSPQHPIHVLMIHGKADPMVPYKGGEVIGNGGKIVSVEALAELWARSNGCETKPVVEKMPKNTRDRTRVWRTIYTAGEKGAEVVLISIDGLGHSWPGTPFQGRRAGMSTRELNASETIWKFFQKHPKTR